MISLPLHLRAFILVRSKLLASCECFNSGVLRERLRSSKSDKFPSLFRLSNERISVFEQLSVNYNVQISTASECITALEKRKTDRGV